MMMHTRMARPSRIAVAAHAPVNRARAVRSVVVRAMPDGSRESALQATIDALLLQQKMLLEQQAALIAQQGVLIQAVSGAAHPPSSPATAIPTPAAAAPAPGLGTYSVSSLSSLLEPDAVPSNFKPRKAMDMSERSLPVKAPAAASADAGAPKLEVRASGPGPKEAAWVKAFVPPTVSGSWEEARKREAVAAEVKSAWIREQKALMRAKEEEERKKNGNGGK
ncbi:hypothetical protein FOA52_012361 [Chlamydomonas sp. UWO 241]|nr:hypothetical protein FOA52_012361 [Chlamydomonas sp. UWO 241]